MGLGEKREQKQEVKGHVVVPSGHIHIQRGKCLCGIVPFALNSRSKYSLAGLNQAAHDDRVIVRGRHSSALFLFILTTCGSVTVGTDGLTDSQTAVQFFFR